MKIKSFFENRVARLEDQLLKLIAYPLTVIFFSFFTDDYRFALCASLILALHLLYCILLVALALVWKVGIKPKPDPKVPMNVRKEWGLARLILRGVLGLGLNILVQFLIWR